MSAASPAYRGVEPKSSARYIAIVHGRASSELALARRFVRAPSYKYTSLLSHFVCCL
jgi:hypothetical protein